MAGLDEEIPSPEVPPSWLCPLCRVSFYELAAIHAHLEKKQRILAAAKEALPALPQKEAAGG